MKAKFFTIIAALPFTLFAQSPNWVYPFPANSAVPTFRSYDNATFLGVYLYQNPDSTYSFFQADEFGLINDTNISIGATSVLSEITPAHINSRKESNFYFTKFYPQQNNFDSLTFFIDLVEPNFEVDTLPFSYGDTFDQDSLHFYYTSRKNQAYVYKLNKSTEQLVDSVQLSFTPSEYLHLISISGNRLFLVSSVNSSNPGLVYVVVDLPSFTLVHEDSIFNSFGFEIPFKMEPSKTHGVLVHSFGQQYQSRLIYINDTGVHAVRKQAFRSRLHALNDNRYLFRYDTVLNINGKPVPKYAILDKEGRTTKVIIDTSLEFLWTKLDRFKIANNNGAIMSVLHPYSNPLDSSIVVFMDTNLTEIHRIKLPNVNGILSFTEAGFLLLHDNYLAYYSFSLGQSEDVKPNLIYYPNPVKEELVIPSLKKSTEYSIHSITGVLLKAGLYNQRSIDVSDLPSGMYVLSLKDYSFRFVKL